MGTNWPSSEHVASGGASTEPTAFDELRALLKELHRLVESVHGTVEPAAVVDEIRCRRLVVVDAEGAERIVAHANGDVAQLLVLAGSPLGVADPTGVELVADGEAGDHRAGVHLVGYGDAVEGIVLIESTDGYHVHRVGDECRPA